MQMQDPFQNQIFSVSQITSFISEILTETFKNITIEGEISNWKPSTSGHVYFTLKDANAQISAVMFKGSTYHLNFKPKDGDKVRCKGSISVYAPRGNYQIIITSMELAGTGNILQMLEQRKQKLAAEGLFNSENKKKLPAFPQTIGVVTSPTGAAIRDILNVTKNRNKSVNILVLPALVQGEGADVSIVKMIEAANNYKLCDILIIGRGGGSLEDLLPFSEESVVRAVAASEIPVISAVGHEIDWAICDYAADVRAATPSQAAEFAVPKLADLKLSLNETKNDLYENINKRVENARLLVKSFNPESLEIRFRNIEQPLLNRFENAKTGLYTNLTEKIKDLRIKLTNAKALLEAANPTSILQRGFSIVYDEDGNVIRDSEKVSENQQIVIVPAKGKISATVNKTSK